MFLDNVFNFRFGERECLFRHFSYGKFLNISIPPRESLPELAHPRRLVGLGLKEINIGGEFLLAGFILFAQIILDALLHFDTIKGFGFRRHMLTPVGYG